MIGFVGALLIAALPGMMLAATLGHVPTVQAICIGILSAALGFVLVAVDSK